MSQSPSNANPGILAAGIWPTLGALRAARAPLVQRFARVVGFPRPLRFVPFDTTADDGWNAIRPNGGGGAWLFDPDDDRGTDLDGTSQTIGIAGGPWRVIPVAALAGGNAVYTLDPTGARRGHRLEVTRQDVSAHTATFLNGGPAAGTLSVMPVSSKAWGLWWFDGADWVQRRGGTMP